VNNSQSKLKSGSTPSDLPLTHKPLTQVNEEQTVTAFYQSQFERMSLPPTIAEDIIECLESASRSIRRINRKDTDFITSPSGWYQDLTTTYPAPYESEDELVEEIYLNCRADFSYRYFERITGLTGYQPLSNQLTPVFEQAISLGARDIVADYKTSHGENYLVRLGNLEKLEAIGLFLSDQTKQSITELVNTEIGKIKATNVDEKRKQYFQLRKSFLENRCDTVISVDEGNLKIFAEKVDLLEYQHTSRISYRGYIFSTFSSTAELFNPHTQRTAAFYPENSIGNQNSKSPELLDNHHRVVARVYSTETDQTTIVDLIPNIAEPGSPVFKKSRIKYQLIFYRSPWSRGKLGIKKYLDGNFQGEVISLKETSIHFSARKKFLEVFSKIFPNDQIGNSKKIEKVQLINEITRTYDCNRWK